MLITCLVQGRIQDSEKGGAHKKRMVNIHVEPHPCFNTIPTPPPPPPPTRQYPCLQTILDPRVTVTMLKILSICMGTMSD